MNRCGLPVIATRHSGIPDLVEDGIDGLLVPEADPRALAQCIGAGTEAAGPPDSPAGEAGDRRSCRRPWR